MAPVSEIFNSHACTYCQEEISGLRVKCADCKDFILCLQCFSNGAEIGPHKNDHPYQFVNTGTLAVVSKSGWTASEELRLLDAIENFGLGNWDEIANHIQTRTPEEAKEEFTSKFLEGGIGRVMWEEAYSKRPELIDLTVPDTGPLGPDALSNLPPLDISTEEATLLGYMPQRDDFDKEHDNTAELLVSSLSIEKDDDELDTALKLAQVDMYMSSLRERMRRKRIVKDYQLVSQFFSSRKERPTKKKLTKEQKEFESKLRFLSQFMTATENESFLNSLHREHYLRRQLNDLKRYRSNGITTIEECYQFNQLSSARQTNKPTDSGNSIPTFHPYQIKKKERKRNSSSIIRKTTFSTELQPTLLPLTEDSLVPNRDSELLSNNELQICIDNQLEPWQYISMKTLLLTQGSNTFTNDDTMGAISAYLESNGWIKSSQQLPN